MQFLIVLLILTVVVYVVSAPLRAQARGSGADARADGLVRGEAIAELEAARDAKYREIRDAELDHSTGKLSDSDYAAVDEALRAEAIEILHALDRAQESPTATIGQR